MACLSYLRASLPTSSAVPTEMTQKNDSSVFPQHLGGVGRARLRWGADGLAGDPPEGTLVGGAGAAAGAAAAAVRQVR